MKEALVKLVKVKSIVTLAVIAAFVYLSVTDKISPDNFMLIVSTIIAFYFGTVSEKKESQDGNS